MKVTKLIEGFSSKFELDEDMLEAVTPAEDEVIEDIAPVLGNEDMYSEAVKSYHKFANLDDDAEITTIDDWALNEAACKHCIQREDLKKRLLGEDVTLDQAAREVEAEATAQGDKTQIEKVLDRALIVAKRKQRKGHASDFPNILLVSDAGFGKTSIVKQWAKENGVNLVYKDAKTMDPAALGGIIARDADDQRYANRLGTKEFQSLDKPNSVLFLDEYNRARSEIRGALLTLVQDHVVWDPTAEGEMRFLPNFLFTVAAINPPNDAYKGAKDMDPAEKSRFYTLPVQPNPIEHLKYLRKTYTAEIQSADDDIERKEFEGKLKLAETILTSPKFTYDSSIDIENHMDDQSYRPLNYRSFKLALDACDGTKADFLDIWNHYCNYDKKHVIEDILHNYQDIKDKANDAIKDDSESEVFAKANDIRSRLRALHPDLNI